MKNCTIPTSKTVVAYKDFDFDRIGNGDVPENCQGDYPHANFFKKVFIPIVRKELKALAKRLGMSIKFEPMYFEWSAYFGKNGKYIYVHCDDVRWNNWYNDMYYRETENDHDSGRGCNSGCSYDQLEQCLTRELG